MDKEKSFKMLFAIFLWLMAASFFLSSYIVRVSPSVMIPYLIDDFQLTTGNLSVLTLSFYLAYIGMQIPVGMLLDKYNLRNLLVTATLLAATGCALFALSSHLTQAAIARFLFGGGVAFAFVGALKVAKIVFPNRVMGVVMGMTQATGMIGAAISNWSVQSITELLGWRATTWLFFGMFCVLAVLFLIFLSLPSLQEEKAQSSDAGPGFFSTLLVVIRNPQSWVNGLYGGLLFAPTAIFGELWGPIFLTSVKGLTDSMAGFANGLIFVGWAVGGPMLGFLSDRIRRRKPVMLLSSISCAVLMFLVIATQTSSHILFVFLFLYGLLNTGVGISYAVASEINPNHAVATSMAFTNMLSILVGISFQPVIGKILSHWGHQSLTKEGLAFASNDFSMVMYICVLCLLLSVFTLFFLKETNCRPVHGGENES